MKRRQNNEAQLEKELGRFFKRLKKEVLKGLDEYWSDYQLLQGQVNLMLSPIHEAHKEYYEIIRKYKLREYRLGKAEAKRLTKRANKDKVALKAVTTLGIQGFVDKDKNSLFGTIPKAEEDLLNRTFRTSQNTLNRVDNQLNQIISDGYREGKGINQVANDITKRFDQLADWEARRIARTEINTSHNQATRDQYKEDGVEYTQWIAANDDRTRDSHAEVDGEIIPIGGKYSNGLAFPGDTSGPLEEWINCRCSNAPFVVPYGFMTPSFSPFRESDLVPINTESLSEPSQEQLEQNLTQEQRSQYEQYTKAVNEAQAIIDSKFSLPRERLQARTQLEYNLSKLNQLKLVANGELARGYQGIIGAVASQPETPTDDQIKQTTNSIDIEPTFTRIEKSEYNGEDVKVYTYPNGTELRINAKAQLTYEEVVNHIKTLPEALQNIEGLTQINIMGHSVSGTGGHFIHETNSVNIYLISSGSSIKALGNLTHELAHAFDFNKSPIRNAYGLSSIEVYEKIVHADNELYSYTNRRGQTRTPRKFPTTYAGTSFKKYDKLFRSQMETYTRNRKLWENHINKGPEPPFNLRYVEDFAESTKLYLNPMEHTKFCKEFPNRAKYLEKLYGKPQFSETHFLKNLILEEQKATERRARSEKEREERFEQLSRKELDQHLGEVLSNKDLVQAYHDMVKEIPRLEIVDEAIYLPIDEGVALLTKYGWDKHTANLIMDNPNMYMNDFLKRRKKLQKTVDQINNLIKEKL